MADIIDLFPKDEMGKGGMLFGVNEGTVEIKEGDSPLTIAQALSLLDRCAIMIKKQAGWLS